MSYLFFLLPCCPLLPLPQLTGERYSLVAAVEVLTHVLREHPILERPGGAPPSLRVLASSIGAAAAGGAIAAPAAAAAGAYGAGYAAGGAYRTH